MQFVVKIVMVVFLTVSFVITAEARTRKIRNGTISMKAGQKAGLHEVLTWNKRCRSVRVKFRKIDSKHGRLYTRSARFRIKKRQSKACAGKSVRGYRVFFKAKRRYKGRSSVRYSLKPANIRDTYVFSRRLRIR